MTNNLVRYSTRLERLRQGGGETIVAPPWMTNATSNLRLLLRAVSDEFLIDPLEILGGGNFKSTVEARMVCMWALNELTRLSYRQIAERLGRSDHSVSMYGIGIVNARRFSDPIFKEMTDAVLTKAEPIRTKPVTALAA